MIHRKTWQYFFCIGVLFTAFSFYNFTIYNGEGASSAPLSTKAAKGQVLWQQKNCFSCHQLYGLGGYLGPDLTNVYSAPGKGDAYIRAFLNSGIKTMPKFNFTEAEKAALVSFLKEVDASGHYPNYRASKHYSGWVEIELKDAQ